MFIDLTKFVICMVVLFAQSDSMAFQELPDLLTLSGNVSKPDELRSVKRKLLNRLLIPKPEVERMLSEDEAAALQALRDEWIAPTEELRSDDGVLSADDKAVRVAIWSAMTDRFIETIRTELPNHYANTVTYLNRTQLADEIRKMADVETEIPNGGFNSLKTILAPSLLDRLNVRDATRREIRRIVTDVERRVAEAESELTHELKRLWDSRVRQILSVLSMEQRDTYDKLFGTLIIWDSISERLKENLRTLVQAVSNGHDHESFNYWDGLEPIELDHVWFTAFSTELFWSEFELSTSQKKKLDELLEHMKKSRVLNLKQSADRFNALLAGEAEVPERAAEILLPHQQARLCQLEIQFRLIANWTSCYLLNTNIRDWLKLDKGQIEQIEDITTRADEERNKTIDAYTRSAQSLRQTAFQSVLDSLNPEQASGLVRVLGNW